MSVSTGFKTRLISSTCSYEANVSATFPRYSVSTLNKVGVYKVRGPSERTKEEEENGQHYREDKVSVVHDFIGGGAGGK
jgi:hypothetical protein